MTEEPSPLIMPTPEEAALALSFGVQRGAAVCGPRSEDEIAAGYDEFRGKCYELVRAAITADPTLIPVRGHYMCPLWGDESAHWWCLRPDGTIVDPAARQFPSAGAGFYTPFSGMCVCSHCGKEVPADEAQHASNYSFCSNRCYGRFVGVC